MNLAGKRIATNDGEGRPTWSPGGRLVAGLRARPNGVWHLWVVDAQKALVVFDSTATAVQDAFEPAWINDNTVRLRRDPEDPDGKIIRINKHRR